jgi:hypothetical protein
MRVWLILCCWLLAGAAFAERPFDPFKEKHASTPPATSQASKAETNLTVPPVKADAKAGGCAVDPATGGSWLMLAALAALIHQKNKRG